MGTHYSDQPAEHWAPPESLDPTPVWKQYLLVGLLLVGSLVLVGVVAAFALAPQLATPPAVVPGGRVVLSRADLPEAGATPQRVGAPLIAETDAFWLAQPERGAVFALRAWWRAPDGRDCPVVASARRVSDGRAERGAPPFVACYDPLLTFDERGAPLSATRGLDRYLVSVDGERVFVNVSRAIRALELVSPTPGP